MSETLTVELSNRQQAWAAIQGQVFPFLKQVLQGGHRWILTLKPETRTQAQNRLLHAALTDISQQVEWMGKKLSVEVWKRLCMAAWLRENNEQPLLIPALDGKGFDIVFERTSKLTTTQCSELLEWCFAFGAEHGVKFRAVGCDGG